MRAAPNTPASLAPRPARRTTPAIVAGVVALLAVLTMLQTLAFITRSVDADNVMTFGSVKMQVLETRDDGTGREIDAPAEETFDAQSGTTSRIVRIRNVGTHPLYVRVALDMTGTASTGETESADDLVKYSFEEGNWAEEDGWHYFASSLAPGETTPPLITSLTVDTAQASARFPHGSLSLHIDARGVQSEHNAKSPIDAAGWPEGAPS